MPCQPINVVPAQAGTHAELPKPISLEYSSCFQLNEFWDSVWVPAFAGTTA
jgi:hypothetical protein